MRHVATVACPVAPEGFHFAPFSATIVKPASIPEGFADWPPRPTGEFPVGASNALVLWTH